MASIMEKAEDRIRVLDVDAVAKDIYKKNTGIKDDLKKTFGPDIIDDNRNILYRKLANIVFSDQIELSKLNRLMFPLIRREIKSMIKSDKDNNYIIIDAAVLFDAKLDLLCDFIVLVDTDEELRKTFLKNKNLNDNEIELRIEGQHIKINKSRVDFRIINDSRTENLRKKTLNIFETVKKMNKNIDQNGKKDI
ncbi:MAG: dephospho-CoA kinase [Actinobacteria bacterium]|nr:dephospho-CoA kinase [Actinomycetota bacterium]